MIQEAAGQQQDLATGNTRDLSGNELTRQIQVEAIAIDNAKQTPQTPETEANEGKTPQTQAEAESISSRSISFGEVPQDLLFSGSKTQTRRDWKPSYMAGFVQDYLEGKLVRALDKGYYAGGKQIGLLKLTAKPRLEILADMKEEDLAAEGFPDMSKEKFIKRFFKGEEDKEVCVIKFKFIPNEPNEPDFSREQSQQSHQGEQSQQSQQQRATTPEPLTPEFEEIWAGSDRAQIFLDIDRGKMLRTVEEALPEKEWKVWRSNRDLNKVQAQLLMDASIGAELLAERPDYQESLLKLFYKSSLSILANCPPEVLDMALVEASNGRRVTKPAVNRLILKHQCATSKVLPQELRQRVADNVIPAQIVAPLVTNADNLPEAIAERIGRHLADKPSIDDLQNMAEDAESSVKFLNLADAVIPEESEIDPEEVLEEAFRIGGAPKVLSVLSGAMADLKKQLTGAWTSLKKVQNQIEQLWEATGESMPSIRQMLGLFDGNFTNGFCAIALPDGTKLQLVEGELPMQPPAAKPAQPAEDAASLQAIAKQIEKVKSDCPELPHAVEGAYVKISSQAKRYAGEVAKVIDGRDQEAIEVTIAGNSIEPTFSAEELAPHKPPREKMSMSVIENSLARLQRGINLAIAGASDKIQSLSAQNQTLEEELRQRSQRIGDLQTGTASAQALQLTNQKLSQDLGAAREELVAAQEALDLLAQQKEKELRIARTNALVSDDASETIQALKDDWKEERSIMMDRLRNADYEADELKMQKAQLQARLDALPNKTENAIDTITRACEKMGIMPLMPSSQTIDATMEAISGCGQGILDCLNSQEANWQAA